MKMIAVGCINATRFSAVSEFVKRHEPAILNVRVGIEFITRPSDDPGFDKLVGVMLHTEVKDAN